MVTILKTADSESNLSRWGFRLLAIGIQCGPPDQTKKVLNLGNQQLSDLREDTYMRATLRAHFSLGIAKFNTLPTPL